MVLVFADHATGGMTLGNASTSDTYSHLQLESLLTHLKAAKLTGEGIELALGADRSESSVRTVMEQEYSISDLTPEEVAAIQAAPAGSMNYVVGPIISQRSSIGWTANGHTGEDIFFWYYGYKKPLRLIENTDIAKMCAHRMGFDLQDVDKKLFVEAGQAFAGTGATLAIDATDPANKALVATKGTKSARIPFATDLIHLADGTKHKDATMKGIAVYISKTGKAYVPKEAAALFQDF
jgi:alkaline phosphatase